MDKARQNIQTWVAEEAVEVFITVTSTETVQYREFLLLMS